MSGDNFTDKSQKTRPVLGDVTNLPSKRGFASISDDLGRKSGDGYVKNTENESGNSAFAKKVCLQVENLVEEMCKSKSEVDSNEKNEHENLVSVVSNAPDEINNMPDLGVTIAQAAVEHGGDASRESYLSSVSMPTCSKKGCDGESAENDIVEEELLVGRACNDKDVGSGRLASSKCGSIEWSRLPNSQGSRSFELERCSGLKGDSCVNLKEGADLLRNCSCSFCLKAAYIWTDLHYQDIKGRISALKKIQKDASFLVQKYGRGKETDIPGRGNANKSSKLESDLMSQWRSLFLHMEDIFGHESSQLQASFATLKDLRENCKTDLERMPGMPLDKY